MFESLSDKLEYALKAIRGQNKLTEDNVNEALTEVRRALLDADVNFGVTKKFIDDVKEKSLGLEVKGNVLPGQLMIKLIHDELVALMGSSKSDLTMAPQAPTIVMVAGLQGSGKTTFCGKLAFSLKKKGKQPLLVACDIYRPAAVDQLKTLGASMSLPVFSQEGAKPAEIAAEALQYAKKYGRDIVIVDTAGRLTIDEEMMQEVADLKALLSPHEVLFVCDAMTGQDAVNTAQAFHERINYDGVVLTKMDGDTRGGAALSIKYTVGKPIKFVSMGEKMETLDVFFPDRMAQRILGMGDIVSLVEKAQSEFDEEEAKRLEKKIKKNKFDFNDFLSQIAQIRKMGDLKSLMNMIPGMSKLTRNLDIDDSAFTRVESIIFSMTPEERANPEVLNMSRKERIARGCGMKVHDVNQFIKQFDDMRKFMHTMSKGNNMQRLMGPGGPFRGMQG